MNEKEHLSEDGLLKIVNLNQLTIISKKSSFCLSKPYPRPDVGDQTIPHPQWIAGFTSGDGSFSVLIRVFTRGGKTRTTR